MNIESDEQYFSLKNILTLMWNIGDITAECASEASNDLEEEYGQEHEECRDCDEKLCDCNCNQEEFDGYDDGDMQYDDGEE